MFCSMCGRQPTKNRTNKGGIRTINPVTKICNECETFNANTRTGEGGARRKMSAAAANDDDIIETTIPEEIANKSGADLFATDIYTIVTTAIQGTNKKIDDLKNDVNDRIVTLENRVKILEAEKEKKDDDINTLNHTVISMHRAFNSLDQGERSTRAVIKHLPEHDMDGNTEGEKLTSDLEKIKQICQLMEYHIQEQVLENLKISRIGKERNRIPRMLKVKFADMKSRDAFIKNSSKMKEAPEVWKKVYIKKDQHPVYVSENNRLRNKMTDLRKLPENAGKDIFIKDGKLTINGSVIDKNLFFH